MNRATASGRFPEAFFIFPRSNRFTISSGKCEEGIRRRVEIRKVYQCLLQKFSIGFLEALYKSSSFDPDTPCSYRANPDAAGVFRPSSETISTIGGDPMTQRVRSPCDRWVGPV